MSNTTRTVIFNQGAQGGSEAAPRAALTEELKKRGFEVLVTNDSKKVFALLETRTDIGFIVTDEEGLNISGTGIAQRLESRGSHVTVAVLSIKQIPPGRVAHAFRKPVNPADIAQFVAEHFATSKKAA